MKAVMKRSKPQLQRAIIIVIKPRGCSYQTISDFNSGPSDGTHAVLTRHCRHPRSICREYPPAATRRASPPARTQCGRKAHTPHAKGVLASTQRSLPFVECAFRCGARASPLQTARRMRHGTVGRGGCRPPIPVSRRGRVHLTWSIVRSADLPLCGAGATVERSHGTRALRESAECTAQRGKRSCRQ